MSKWKQKGFWFLLVIGYYLGEAFFHSHKLSISPQNLYKKAWDKVKATSYALPSDSVALARAKELKHNASIVSELNSLFF